MELVVGLVSAIVLAILIPTEGAPTDAHVRNKRVALSNYRKHFDIIGSRTIDEHHEYHDYGPHDYNDYHGKQHYDYHGDYHFGDYFDHDDKHDYHDYHGGDQHMQGGYGQQMSYKPKPQILIIKKIVPLSTTTAP